MDRILSTIGLGEKYLEPKRDLLTGEPIEKTPNALYINPDGIASFSFWFQGPSLVGRKVDVKENRVLLEITSLKIPLEEPSKVKYKTIDFTQIFNKDSKQSAYDYWTENIGKIKDSSGDTLMQKLEKEINSRDYKLREEGDVNFDGGKELTLKLIFNGYKQLAYYDMLKKYPQAMNDIKSVLKKQGEMLGKSKDEDIDDTRDLLPFDGTKDSFFFSLMSKAEAAEVDIGSDIQERKILANNNFIDSLWGIYYQTSDDPEKNESAKKRLNKNYKVPEDAKKSIDKAAYIFEGDRGFSSNTIKDYLSKIGQVESQYKTKRQYNDGPARSYWQVEPSTAKDILTREGLNQGGFLGKKFEEVFKKYAKKDKSAVEYLKELSDKELGDLLEKDGDLGATFATVVIISRFPNEENK